MLINVAVYKQNHTGVYFGRLALRSTAQDAALAVAISGGEREKEWEGGREGGREGGKEGGRNRGGGGEILFIQRMEVRLYLSFLVSFNTLKLTSTTELNNSKL